MTTQIEGQNKDIQEIKQFLKLLVPRIVGIEASYKVLSTENPIMESQQKPRPIKRKNKVRAPCLFGNVKAILSFCLCSHDGI